MVAIVASVSCDPYTLGQVAHGLTYGGVVTGVDYGYGHVTGYGAVGNRGYYGLHHGYYGKREAEAEPYTIAQVHAGLPQYNAWATGHAHNPGFISYVSHAAPLHHVGYYGKRDAEPYTIAQVHAGLPQYNAWATGHAHNPGVISYVSHGYPYAAFYGK